MRQISTLLAMAAALAAVPPLHAQRMTAPPTAADSAAAFTDPGAAALFGRARAARLRTDHSIVSYSAVVRSRLAAGMRMPLKDRTLFRSESAARVRWSRFGPHVVEVLASREQHPGGVEVPDRPSGPGIDELFDPSDDRLYFGMSGSRRDSVRAARRDSIRAARRDSARARGETPDTIADDDEVSFWIEHPLGDAAERHYRFTSGDTLTIRLQDGTVVRVIELRVTPRRDDPHTVRGTLWIDAASGALVQAAFRLARTVDILRDFTWSSEDDREGIDKVPGFLKPFEFDVSLVTLEYSLWEMQHWLPRTMRVEGMARAGVLRFPASFDVGYDMLDVLTEGDSASEASAARAVAAEWMTEQDSMRTMDRMSSGQQYVVLMPRDSMRLLRSDDLPPPIWSDAPGFASSEEIERMSDRLASLGGAIHRESAPEFGWGLGEMDMVRYNRIESLSVGAHGSVGLREAEASGTLRIGLADLHPNAELKLRRETMRRSLELRGYHELATADVSRDALGLGNSLSALVLGRDAGEYYRASGAALTVAPPSFRRRTWELAAYAEYQNDVRRNTHVALPRLWDDSVFRPNITAAEAMQYGGLLQLRPWWGSDPLRAQFGVEMMLQGETGDYDLARGSLTLRAAAPLTRRFRLAAEAGVGSSAGDVTPQRMFYLGGANTLRGYEPSTVAGTSMARARLELGRTASFGAVSVFSDWGWAGDREDIRNANQRWSVGAGASLLDGLLRIDLAHGLREPRGWRLDLHLDAIM
ncbi:MAG TPA: BamA/TamA family outer membrane protein [Longimicrobiales bacterium]